jgi:hypothetical protein
MFLLRASSAETKPLLKPAREFIMVHRRECAPITWVPTPHDKFVGGNMLDYLRERLTVVLLWILYLPANLTGRAAFPDHWHIGRWQMPVWRAWRHVKSSHVLFLVARAALLPILTVPVRPASHILDVNTSIVTLSWEITGRVAIEATWVFQNRNN